MRRPNLLPGQSLLVVAPKGVHVNWVQREIPRHMSTPVKAVAWGKNRKALPKLLEEREELTVFAINIDAINTKDGFEFCKAFLTAHRCMMVVDESQRIKTPSAKRTPLSLGSLRAKRSSGHWYRMDRLTCFRNLSSSTPASLGRGHTGLLWLNTRMFCPQTIRSWSMRGAGNAADCEAGFTRSHRNLEK